MDITTKLEERLKQIGDSYLMFSGGLDSCAILGTAIKAGIHITPVWINNGFGRASEDEIRKQAQNMGAHHLKVIDITPTKTVVSNPDNRCYFCKNQIIEAIKHLEKDAVIMDGTTGSDNGYRPGRKALNEQGVISPLAELNISSTQAKDIALSLGANKQIADLESCIATRFNYLQPLTDDRLKVLKEIEHLIIEETEDFNVRCRLDDNDHIRIELSDSNSFLAFNDPDFRNAVIELGEKLALFTTLDLKPSRPNAYDNRITNDI
ncbi:exoenzyme S synthesis protein B [Plebeiibacterium sediminum]|uniref:Exoenzyme S synthesis protein B n=1 Tax=Plebeiibacterium sediminum TaxID=2992112 RepID=A0AAE3M0T7_9BACT|nr:exoenzyme S synthesis protein B [Plebeiobacterium sediminum]MCW3785084.1 exoenzyme S synthesis protein B [Plebeiobacterium sediminum]